MHNDNPEQANNHLVPVIPSTLFGIKFGIGIGIGLAIIWLPIISIGYALVDNDSLQQRSHTFESNAVAASTADEPPQNYLPKTPLGKPSPAFSSKLKFGHNHTVSQQLEIPSDYRIYKISTAETLLTTLDTLPKSQQKVAFVMTKGIYRFTKTIRITQDNIWLVSETANPNDVIFAGRGMRSSAKVNNLIYVSGKHFKLAGITLKQASNHLIQIAGEKDADYPIIENCILQDSYEQMIKVSYDKRNKPNIASDKGLIQNCLFEYTEGVGPNYYIGGIDIHGGEDWQILNNSFKNIASPRKHIAEHAIHFWNNTKNPSIIGNYIKNCDRGIGLGMLKHSIERNQAQNIKYSNLGGVIKQNYVYHDNNDHPFADTGIILEDSAQTLIEGNYIYLAHSYPRAIEYRYPSTTDVKIINNVTNKTISSRDGGQAMLENNRVMLNRASYPKID